MQASHKATTKTKVLDWLTSARFLQRFDRVHNDNNFYYLKFVLDTNDSLSRTIIISFFDLPCRKGDERL